jgi:hypothetical protein
MSLDEPKQCEIHAAEPSVAPCQDCIEDGDINLDFSRLVVLETDQHLGIIIQKFLYGGGEDEEESLDSEIQDQRTTPMLEHTAIFIEDDGQDNVRRTSRSISSDSPRKLLLIVDCATSTDKDTSGVETVEAAAMKEGHPEGAKDEAGVPHSQNNQGVTEQFPKPDEQCPTAPCATSSTPTPTRHPDTTSSPVAIFRRHISDFLPKEA